VTLGAVHGVDLHPGDQILIRWRQRIVYARSATVNRIIERTHREVAFPSGGMPIGFGWQKSEQGKPSRDQYQDSDCQNNTKNEFAHAKTPRLFRAGANGSVSVYI
jgi:hypothetical protein